MTYSDLLHAIGQRWRLVLGVSLAVLLLVLGWTLASPRQYQATASLLFDFADNIQPAGQAPSQAGQASALGTQADVIRSEQVASQVVAAQRLAERPELERQWRAESGGRLAFDRWLAERLLHNVRVQMVKNSNVVAITYLPPIRRRRRSARTASRTPSCAPSSASARSPPKSIRTGSPVASAMRARSWRSRRRG